MKTKWYRSTQRRGRALSALLALVLAVGLVLAVPPLDGLALATDDTAGQEAGEGNTAQTENTNGNASARGGALDLSEGSCSLTLKFPEKGANVIGSSEEVKSPQEGDVKVDLYKIADAVQLPGYQTYQFEIASGSALYGKMIDLLEEHEGHGWQTETVAANGGTLLHFYYAPDNPLADNPRDWSSLVDVLARFCLDKDNRITPARTNCDFGTPIGDLDPGLYLTVVHGPDTDFAPLITDNGDQYKDEGAVTAQTYPAWTTEQTVAGTYGRLERAGTGDFITTLASAAYDDTYLYLFQPQLVSLPGYAVDGSQQNAVPNNTGWNGTWTSDVTLYTKHTETPRYADLQIVKLLPTYLASETGTAFVYEIVATDGQGNVYRTSETLVFNGPKKDGQRTGVIVDHIPVGWQVTITERYAGNAYLFDPAHSGAWALGNTGRLPTGNGTQLAAGRVNEEARTIVIPADEVVAGSIRLAVKKPDAKDSGLGSVRLDVGRTEIAVFQNILGESNKGGGAVVNRFEGDNQGNWSWTKRVYDPATGTWTDQQGDWSQRVAASGS